MIDINLIRENPEEVKAKLAKKLYDVDFTEFLEKDKERKALRYENDSLKSERNKTSALVPQLKKEGKDATEIIENMKKLGDKKEWVYIVLLLGFAYYFKHHPFLHLYGNNSMQVFRIYLFMMGMATGYFCRIMKRREWYLSKGKAVVGNVAANLVILAVFLVTLLSSPMFLIKIGIDIRGQYYGVGHDMFFGVLAMVWIVCAVFCTAGPIVKFFGNPVFVHLSERSFGIYLFHMLLRINATAAVPDGYKNFMIIMFFSICIAEVLYVILEKPIGDFGKHLSFKKLGQYYKGLFVRE